MSNPPSLRAHVDDLFNKVTTLHYMATPHSLQLIGAKGFHTEKSYIISKDGIPENILTLLKLLASSEPDLQVLILSTLFTSQLYILNNLICLLYKSSRNLHYCQNLDVLGVVLEILPSITNRNIFGG